MKREVAGMLAGGDAGWYVMAVATSDAYLGQTNTIIKENDSVQEKGIQT